MGSPLPVDSKHTLMQWKSSSACAKNSGYVISRDSYTYSALGFSRSAVKQFPEGK